MAQSAGRQGTGKGRPVIKAADAEHRVRADSPNGVAQNMTDLDFLRGLIDAVDQSGIDTLEINRAGTRIRISKTPASVQGGSAAHPSLSVAMPAHASQGVAVTHGVSAPVPAAAGSGDAATGVAPVAPVSNLVDVKSPMVGTFYRAPAPDAPPYVEPGTSVSKGQTLCILEAMKLMNELECEVDGVVREVLVEDADPVEFGQVLFRIEPSGSK
jgi:acetyl-CoA carboxylase biotin carboxyl carrier protein